MNEKIKNLVDKLEKEHILTVDEFTFIIDNVSDDDREYIRSKAQGIAKSKFGNKVYTRGIVEFSNICKNDCYYCGIRKSNKNFERYRLTKEQILDCCESGYAYDYRTFVLQSGEDPYYTDEVMCDIVSTIREKYTDCAITLSIGERSRESYQKLFDAGANRYLLRHETANKELYEKLHPSYQNFEVRMQCLRDLKDIGYQVGTGMMIGAPFQTHRNLAEDLVFLGEFKPHMVGTGPFIPHKDTDFRNEKAGTLEMVLLCLSLVRIMLPNVLLPATTALGSINPIGREKGVLAGANVIMPNLSPTEVRKNYLLYDNKICVNDASSQCKNCINARMIKIGYEVEVSRGDYKE